MQLPVHQKDTNHLAAKCRKRTDWLPGTPLKNMREFTDRHFMMPQKRLILTGKTDSTIQIKK